MSTVTGPAQKCGVKEVDDGIWLVSFMRREELRSNPRDFCASTECIAQQQNMLGHRQSLRVAGRTIATKQSTARRESGAVPA
jgi:hypothetical protein